MILSLSARFDRRAAHGLRAMYELALGEDRFRIHVADDEIEIGRGRPDQPEATITTDPDTLAALLRGGQPLSAARRSGKLAIDGDNRARERFMRLFPIPSPPRPLEPHRLQPIASPGSRLTRPPPDH
jgi:putative sterol carrier protein